MRQTLQAVVVLLVWLAGSCLAGCSGAGAPARSGRLTALEAVAGDHLTALLHVKRWFGILYPTPPARPCSTGATRLKPQPGDPPGSMRMRLALSDCTKIEVLQRKDGSGSQVVTFPDGRQKTVTWGVARREPGWVKQDVSEALWDGHRLDYEVGISTAGDPYDRYERGTATLADGRTMGIRHDRNLNRDAVELRPDDGSQLQFETPLASVGGKPFQPVHETGAAGTFTSPEGRRHAFAVRGASGDGWRTWDFSTDAGTTARLTLDADLAGSGTLSEDGEVAALLRWAADGRGTLTPLGAADIAITPSAAARDFRIDQWIHNVAALGPSPMY